MATTILAICLTVLHSSDQKAPPTTPLPPLPPKLQALHILAHPLFSSALKGRILLRYGKTRATDLACCRSPRTYSTAPRATLLHHRFSWSLQGSQCILQIVTSWILSAFVPCCREQRGILPLARLCMRPLRSFIKCCHILRTFTFQVFREDAPAPPTKARIESIPSATTGTDTSSHLTHLDTLLSGYHRSQ
jgi:hypothetical protein